MTCPVWQQLLDEHPHGLPTGVLEQHALGCDPCSAQQVEHGLLLSALPRLSPPAPPEGLAERITAAVLEDRHRRARLPRRWAPVAALVAASLLLAAGLGIWRPAPSPPASRPALIVRVEPKPSLREAAENAQEAGTRLLARTAEGTAERAGKLFPSVSPMPLETDPGPALQPLSDTAEEVTAGIAPVTQSARRAVNLFLRDLPLGLKPG